jgi:DNA-binding XRE family transcriptional regulator
MYNGNQTVIDHGMTARDLKKARSECGILYKLVRHRLGLTQREMAKLLRVRLDTIINRENRKSKYTIREIVALQRASGIDGNEMWEILVAVAK